MKNITLKDFFQIFYRSRVLFCLTFFLSSTLGLLVYKITPAVYSSSVKFLPVGTEDKSKQSGLSSLATLAGVDLMSSNAGVPVASYGTILQSPLFLLNVIGQEVVFDGDTVLLHNYLQQRVAYSFSEKFQALGKPLADKVVVDKFTHLPSITTEDLADLRNLPVLDLKWSIRRSINILKEAIGFMDETPQHLIISVELNDPGVSAQVAKMIVIALEEFLKNFSKESKSDRSGFLTKEVDKAKAQMFSAQDALASAVDGNINVNKARAKVNVERLQLNFSTAQRNYLSLLSEYNNAKLGLERDQGIFIVLDSPAVGNIKNPSSPKLIIYTILSVLFGLFFSSLLVLTKYFIRKHFWNT